MLAGRGRRGARCGGLFEPLGYAVDADAASRSTSASRSGATSRYFTRARCAASVRLRDLLTHLYVLIPVLDDEKHYWVGDDEVEKLLRRGEGWLAGASRSAS